MDKELRNIAYAIVAQQIVDKKKMNALIERLSVEELRTFVKYLKDALARNTITVTAAAEASDEIKKFFDTKYKDKRVLYQKDESIGGGLVVKIEDDVYDYSVKNYIETTVNTLQNEL